MSKSPQHAAPQRLRLTLAILWCSFWVLTSILSIAIPWLRKDKAILPEQVPSILEQVSGIWLPPLSCFVGFWYSLSRPPVVIQRSDPAPPEEVGVEARVLAVGLTVVYLSIVFALVALALFAPYQGNEKNNLDTGASLTERLAEAVKYSLLVSPVALAPVAWITGYKPKSPAAPDHQ